MLIKELLKNKTLKLAKNGQQVDLNKGLTDRQARLLQSELLLHVMVSTHII